jgi:hypothetical protein
VAAGTEAVGIGGTPGIVDIDGAFMSCSIILLLPMFMESQQLGRAMSRYKPAAMMNSPTAMPVIARAW